MEMNSDHWLLTGYWILFTIVHHVTASEKFKSVFRLAMGAGFKYYRLLYSGVAFISLGFVMSRQFSITSIKLDVPPWLSLYFGLPFGIIGICLMGACIRKYFFNQSGIGVFLRNDRTAILEFHGIHKYIRHPLYLGTLQLIWSAFLFFPLLSNLLACVVINAYIVIGIRFEERKLVTIFGKAYESYRKKTPRLIPNFHIH